MDGTLDLTIRGGPINLNNITQTQSVIVKLKKKYFLRMSKGMVNFYIYNAIGQNLANSEPCLILRLL